MLFFLDTPGMLSLLPNISPWGWETDRELNMELLTARGSKTFFWIQVQCYKPTTQYFSVRLGNPQRTKHGTQYCNKIKLFFGRTAIMLYKPTTQCVPLRLGNPQGIKHGAQYCKRIQCFFPRTVCPHWGVFTVVAKAWCGQGAWSCRRLFSSNFSHEVALKVLQLIGGLWKWILGSLVI